MGVSFRGWTSSLSVQAQLRAVHVGVSCSGDTNEVPSVLPEDRALSCLSLDAQEVVTDQLHATALALTMNHDSHGGGC